MNKEKAMQLMSEFPQITEELEDKIRLRLKQYLLIDKKNSKAYCTHCKHTFDIYEIPKHRETIPCPMCYGPVTAILNHYSFAGTVVESTANVVVLMSRPENDNLYISCFTAKVLFNEYQLIPTYSLVETQRYIFTDKQCYRYGRNKEYRYVKKNELFGYYISEYSKEWTPRHKMREPVFDSQTYYDVVGDEAIKDTCYRYSAAELYDGKAFIEYLCFWRKHKGAERLLKAGLSEYVKKSMGLYGIENNINWNENEVHKMLGVPADVCRAIREKRISLSDYKDIKKKFPDENLDTLISYNSVIRYQFGTLSRLSKIVVEREKNIIKYLLKAGIYINDYFDYIEVCQYLGYNLRDDKQVKFPHKFWAAHDRAIEARQILVAEREKRQQQELQKKFQKKMHEREKYEFAFGNYVIIQPRSMSEIVSEGSILSHCVGGYARRHAEGTLSIMFLRKADNVSKPYYTIEVRDNKIIQCRGYKNNVVSCGGEEKPQEIIDVEKAYQSYLDTLKHKSNKKKARKSA